MNTLEKQCMNWFLNVQTMYDMRNRQTINSEFIKVIMIDMYKDQHRASEVNMDEVLMMLRIR